MAAKKNFPDKYFIGLDCGTDSVGWAVTDEQYNILNFNHKALWGIRLFDQASTAEERRMHRTTRRRRQREVQRIEWLQELFSEEICKIDPGFFVRMKDSPFAAGDKTARQRNSLFNDPSFKDSDYHRQFPTIYHLRNHLRTTKAQIDVRLLYLAIHSIIKKRGNFLYESNFETIPDLGEVLDGLSNALQDELDLDLGYDKCNLEDIKSVLKDSKLGVNGRLKELEGLFSAQETDGKAKQRKAVLTLVSGGKSSLDVLFNDEDLKDAEDNKVKFSEIDFEEKGDKLQDALGDRFFILEKIKSVYDWSRLAAILGDSNTISEAKIKLYEQHKSDLKALREVIRNCCPEKYYEVFKDPKQERNYLAYIGNFKRARIRQSHKTEKCAMKKCKPDDFYKYAKSVLDEVLKKNPDNKTAQDLYEKAEGATLLPKLSTVDNSTIPKQLNEKELKDILANAALQFAFLNKKDSNGITAKEKILKIFNYRIPYYVGPLNQKSPFAWLERKGNEKIVPWNFEEQVDLDLSAERFIQRMTNKCTYLVGKDVLPKHSLLYEKFTVLNEINNLTIEGNRISVETKKRIYNELFMRFKKVTAKRLKNFLHTECGYTRKDTELLGGVDGDCKSSLSAHIDFKDLLENKTLGAEDVEQIIKWIVLFGESRKLLERRIKTSYGKKLQDDQIKAIVSRRYSGWGRLSKEFLTLPGEKAVNTAGEIKSIIDRLYDDAENPNLMMLLSSDYDYRSTVDQLNGIGDQIAKLDYSVVKDLYLSPAVKRPLWQTLRILDELERIIGHKPAKVFVEVTRSDEKGGKKGKTPHSRKNALLELYKTAKEDARDLERRTDEDLRQDKLYLYYAQLGKCMYTNEPIDIENLSRGYDIDHIYPQSLIKDDSMDNRVLVKKTSNAAKGDKYPLDSATQAKMRPFWQHLLDHKLISLKKFNRLVRATSLTKEELADFVNRQLVETGQTAKAVADIIKRWHGPETIYVKPKLVSDFRFKFNMLKCRAINDLHHAKDAYLNIVCGNVHTAQYTDDVKKWVSDPKSEAKIKDTSGYFSLNSLYRQERWQKGHCAWKPGENGTIKTIRKHMDRSNVLFTRYSYDQKGVLFDVQPVKKGRNDDLLPLKAKDPRYADTSKYGGYNGCKGSFFTVVRQDKKYRLETMPLYLKNDLRDEQNLKKYCIDKLGYRNPEIVVPHLKYGFACLRNGFLLSVQGKTGNRFGIRGCVQLAADIKRTNFFHHVCKYNEEARSVRERIKRLQGAAAKPADAESKAEMEKCLKKLSDLVPRKREPNSEKVTFLLTDENLLEAYDWLIEKGESKAYRGRPNNQTGKLKECRARFVQLPLHDKAYVLEEILHMFGCGTQTKFDLEPLGASKNAGASFIPNTFSDDMQLINYSCTGIFEKRLDVIKK